MPTLDIALHAPRAPRPPEQHLGGLARRQRVVQRVRKLVQLVLCAWSCEGMGVDVCGEEGEALVGG